MNSNIANRKGLYAEALRRAFDQSFAAAPSSIAESTEDLIAIRVAGDAYALRIADLVGLTASRKIVPLLARSPGLLGIAGIRGVIVPVYSLARLLGYETTDPARWLALCGGSDVAALAFDELEGFLRVQSSDVCAAEQIDGRRHVRQVVRAAGVTHSIVDVSATLPGSKIDAGSSSTAKEH